MRLLSRAQQAFPDVLEEMPQANLIEVVYEAAHRAAALTGDVGERRVVVVAEALLASLLPAA